MIPFCLNNRQFTSSQVGNFPAGMNYSLGKVRPGYTIFLVICLCTMCMLSHFSHVWLCATPWTVAHQPPLSMGFFRQEYWNGWPCPPPGDLPDPGMEASSLASPALAESSLPLGATWEALSLYHKSTYIYISIYLSPIITDLKGGIYSIEKLSINIGAHTAYDDYATNCKRFYTCIYIYIYIYIEIERERERDEWKTWSCCFNCLWSTQN